ncbi:MAG: CdaR family protein [Actinobacteria bacterium]|nr:CdaR family protein [Actinomycetota bacterium]
MSGIDWRNMSLRILSVLLALLLWLYVTNEQNPVHSQILSVNLSQRGLSQNMSVVGNIPRSVSIRVQGTRGQISSLTTDDFEAVLDLSGLEEGDRLVQVKVNSPAGIQIVQVNPGKVPVTLEGIVEQQVQVTASLKGAPVRGFYVLNPVVAPQTVTVRGPRSKVSAITQLGVTVEVEGVNSDVEKILPVAAPQSGVSVYPQSVKVTVPVSQLPTKSVPVRTGAVGSPSAGYEVDGITVSPAEVQVTAPAEVLAQLRWVEAEKVNISGADRDVTVRAAVALPTNAVEVKPAAVEITARLKKTETPPPAGGDSGASQSNEGQ